MMIPELGHYALILAFFLALSQAIIPFIGVFTERLALMNVAKSAAYGQCLLLSLTFAALAYAFINNDFSVAYVAANSNSQLPWMYKFCAVWGAHEGSLLLWVLILSFWTVAVAKLSQGLPIKILAQVLAILGMISVGFLLFLLKTSDPFIRLLPNFPADGRDLNPLLQDPGLVMHPPMLYMGYVGFAVAFAFAMVALIRGKLDANWARWSKPWTLGAWCFLTLGIILGSWWAYRELGWGGWWFWDPVENASFLPWLAGTALFHSLVTTEKRNAFQAWAVLLAIFTFSLSLMGTFLVRSGILISVHAFAVDPLRGVFMLGFLVIVVGSSLLLYACRTHKMRNPIQFSWFSRESLLLMNNLLLTAAMLTILLGTLYPLIIDILNLGKISVGPQYFNGVFTPFMMCILVFMGMAPWSRWRNTEGRWLLKKLWLTGAIAVMFALIVPWFITKQWNVLVWGGLSLACWVIFSTVQWVYKKTQCFTAFNVLKVRQWGMVAAHLGVAVSVIGVVLTSEYSMQREVRVLPGDTVVLGNYEFHFIGTRKLIGPNYSGVEGGVWVSKNQQMIDFLKPQQRIYNVQKVALANTAINAGLFRDLYVALGEPLEQDAWSLRVYYKPFIRWIWVGGLLMMLGGGLALIGRRQPQKKAVN